MNAFTGRTSVLLSMQPLWSHRESRVGDELACALREPGPCFLPKALRNLGPTVL